MQWYDETQLNAQRAAHILLRKLPQVLQRQLAAERFDALRVDFIYYKAQDYMNWLFISPTGWKHSLGDFMDLDTCAVQKTELVLSPTEEVSVYVASNSCQVKPVLDRDSIRWQIIDGP